MTGSHCTILAPLHGRETVRCLKCRMIQFLAKHQHCRRCLADFDEAPPKIVEPIVVVSSETAGVPLVTKNWTSINRVSIAVKTLRVAQNISQRELAARMKVPRTYVSKIENQIASPTLASFNKFASALNVSTYGLALIISAIE